VVCGHVWFSPDSSFPENLVQQTLVVQSNGMKLLFFALISLPICLIADGLPSQPYIYVEGRAQIEKPADFVGLRFQVIGRNAERAKANEQVQASVNRVLALFKQANIADNDIVAEDLNSEPEYDQADDVRRNKLIGYKVIRPIGVNVRDTVGFAKLVDQLIALGDIEFNQIEGGLSKYEQIEDELWQRALINARERGERTVKPMGMKIDSVFAASPIGFPEIQGRILTNLEPNIVTGSAAPPGKERVEPSHYRLAPVVVSRTVNIIYLISQAK